ncbi:EFR1 family ferrodoxin [Clostridium saccharoperbutylacetonicum]|uniref:EFR1 family ferrodoxin n=1 Tax=Clostridium saccharoperbutylacetonicum TaxID=36745 RepID=UPI0039ED8294
MKIFYFTATGNSLYVAKKIGGELYSIPQMIKAGEYEFEDEAIGFVFPCHGFGMAKIVSNFIKKSKFKADYFFAIMTYGAKPFSGLRHIELVAKESGIKFNYTNEILMVDNFLSAFKMEEEIINKKPEDIDERLNKIIADITNRRKSLVTKGATSNLLSKCCRGLADKLSNNFAAKRFIVNDNCTSCKICEKVCPANNIKVENKPKFLSRCETCLACIHHCPQNAIHMKSEKSKARFINQNVKLKELIDSNNQDY